MDYLEFAHLLKMMLHIFMTPDQIESEIIKLINFIDRVYKSLNLSYEIELSTRPEENILVI